MRRIVAGAGAKFNSDVFWRRTALVCTRRQHTMNLFVWPEASEAGPVLETRAIRGFHVRHWVRGDMSYWAVSDVNDTELDQFVHALQQ